MGLMTAFLCVLAPIAIPIGPVPISLTPLVIYLIVYLIGGVRGTICYGLYLLIGLIGLPVFSGFTGGLGKLSGPTGGYLIGFILTAALCGLSLWLGKGRLWIYIIGMVLGICVAYLFGTVWFMISLETSLLYTLKVCVYPFLPVDAIKIALAAVVGPLIKRPLMKVSELSGIIRRY